jgi:hypothetical protein
MDELSRLYTAGVLGGVDDTTLHRKLMRFWRFVDRTIPDAFAHANIGPDDNRVIPQRPGLSPYWDASLAAVRDSGYADDTSVQIPGEIERIEVSGARVRVMFRVQENSPICLRRTYTNEGYVATTHCPAPGRHAWTYAWTPRDFRRVD